MVYKEKMYSQRGIVSYMSKTDRNLRFPEHFSAAIFDFDGTLAVTTRLWQKIDREFFESRNIPYDATLSEHISPLGFTDGARWVIETYHLHESVDHIIDEWTTKGRAAYQNDVVLRPGAEKYLRYLRSKGIATALATVNDANVFRAMEARIPFHELFDVVAFGSEVGYGKDRPDLYTYVLSQLKTSAHNTIIFEDLPVALKTAQSLSLITCAVKSDDPTQDMNLLTPYADYTINSWNDPRLMGLTGENNGSR